MRAQPNPMVESSERLNLRRRSSQAVKSVDDDVLVDRKGKMVATATIDVLGNTTFGASSSSPHRQMKENPPGNTSHSAEFQPLNEIRGSNHQRSGSMDLGNPHKKKIFLSYSGAQKEFVDQLDLDLRNRGYLPFFDKDPASLPKGEEFPELILRATRECRVAVVVLSEEYLLSKWPMIELAGFVKAKKSVNPRLKILPLFYKLKVSALKDEATLRRIRERWGVLASEDMNGRIRLSEWTEALSAVNRINGMVFDGGSVVDYREEIVDSICRLCLPNRMFNVPNMDHWCIDVAKELEKLEGGSGAAIVGLHGSGGMGKTTLCEALCNHFCEQFVGRVCVVDFSKGDSPQGVTYPRDSLKVKKEILRTLTNISVDGIARGTQVDEEIKCKVFLAIDNVSRSGFSIKEELESILNSLPGGSMSVVTSRSSETLKGVLPSHSSHIMSMPILSEKQALNIFVYAALPDRLPPSSTKLFTFAEMKDLGFSTEELVVIKTCVARCIIHDNTPAWIKLLFVKNSIVYHPMGLQSLGYFLRTVVDSRYPLEWDKQGKIPKQLSDNQDTLEEIFSIFEPGYQSLGDTDKLLFMDVAVFAPREKLWSLESLWKWVEGVHSIGKEADMTNRLTNLGALGFLEKDDYSVTLHDLYIEFAHYMLKKMENDLWCVYHTQGNSLPLNLQSRPPGTCWPYLKRVKLQAPQDAPQDDARNSLFYYSMDIPSQSLFYKFRIEKLGEWVNLHVLHLDFGGEHIDIGPLEGLRNLHLNADQSLKTFTCSSHLEYLGFVKFICLQGKVTQVPAFTSTERLQELDMDFHMFSLQRPLPLPRVASTTTTSALTVLRLSKWYSSRLRNQELQLDHFPNLTELMIHSEVLDHGQCRLSISGLERLTNLKTLSFRALPIQGPLLGLENLTSLEVLVLRLCWRITALPGLGHLKNLLHLSVSSTDVENLDGLDELTNLQELYCLSCGRLRHVPDLSSLPDLFIVDAHGCNLLQDFSVPNNCVKPPWVRREVEDEIRHIRSMLQSADFSALLQAAVDRGVEITQLLCDRAYTPASGHGNTIVQTIRAEVNSLQQRMELAIQHPHPSTSERVEAIAMQLRWQRLHTLVRLMIFLAFLVSAPVLAYLAFIVAFPKYWDAEFFTALVISSAGDTACIVFGGDNDTCTLLSVLLWDCWMLWTGRYFSCLLNLVWRGISGAKF